jgi:hypothetical protein
MMKTSIIIQNGWLGFVVVVETEETEPCTYCNSSVGIEETQKS